MTNTDPRALAHALDPKTWAVLDAQENRGIPSSPLLQIEKKKSLEQASRISAALFQAGLEITPKDSGWQWVERDYVPLDWQDGSGGFAVTCGWGDNKKIYLNCAFRAGTWETSGIALDYMAIGHVCQPVIPPPPIKQGDEG